MSKVLLPKQYTSKLNLFDTQMAIQFLKKTFENNLSENLSLSRVSAPLFLDPNSGLNDDLNGIERPVTFDVMETGKDAQVIHSLAKWKRLALHKYGFKPFTGLYTDMNAIRRDEEMDNLHSIYTDQWDWEKVITKESRNLDFLKETATLVVNSLVFTLNELKKKYPQLTLDISNNITFVTTEELYNLYPDLTAKERENQFVKIHKTCFIMKIGDLLPSGKKHDGRAPDYDDWSLNGDIVIWNELLQCPFEISSMGIRVDKDTLESQLAKSGCEQRAGFPFHQQILTEKLPLTIGGGIGQSRVSMLLLEKAHIGEVQCSLWDDKTIKICKENNISLL